MKLEEMKRIAAARLQGEWTCDYWMTHPNTWRAVFEPRHNRDEAKADADFIYMAFHNWDKLMAVVEAAKESICGGGNQSGDNCAMQDELIKALKEFDARI